MVTVQQPVLGKGKKQLLWHFLKHFPIESTCTVILK